MTSLFSRMGARARIIVLCVAAVVLIGGVVTGVDAMRTFHKIYPGISVAGVDVGGMTVEEASAAISERFDNDSIATRSFVVFDSQETADSYDAGTLTQAADGSSSAHEWVLSAQSLGATVDSDLLANMAYQTTRSRDGGFLAKLRAVFGGLDLPIYVSCSADGFQNAVDSINSSGGRQPMNAGIQIDGDTVSTTQPSDGWLIDEQTFLAQITDALLFDGGDFVAPFESVPYQFDVADAEKVAENVQNALGYDVTLSYAGQTWTFPAADIDAMITTRVDGTGPSARLVPCLLADDSDERMQTLLGDAGATQGAVDARFDTSSGEVQIIPSQKGTGPDLARARSDIESILFSGGDLDTVDRTVMLVDTQLEPALSTDVAATYGINELISSYTLSTAGSDSAKLHNIATACEAVGYVLIAPGQSWSWNDYVGDTTEDKGYEAGRAVADGQLVDSIGGGICAVATTVFNAVYEGGLQVDERHNHSMYFYSYPAGRDSSISYGSYDLRWTNNTGSWILMENRYSEDGEYITCELWGTSPGYTVETDMSDWTEGDTYKTVKVNDDTLAVGVEKVQQHGMDGRSITVTRHVFKGDTEVETDVFSSYYQPADEIILVGTAPAAGDSTGSQGTTTTSNTL